MNEVLQHAHLVQGAGRGRDPAPDARKSQLRAELEIESVGPLAASCGGLGCREPEVCVRVDSPVAEVADAGQRGAVASFLLVGRAPHRPTPARFAHVPAPDHGPNMIDFVET